MAKWTNKQDTQIAIPQNTYSTSKYMMATIQLAKSEYYLPILFIHYTYFTLEVDHSHSQSDYCSILL